MESHHSTGPENIAQLWIFHPTSQETEHYEKICPPNWEEETRQVATTARAPQGKKGYTWGIFKEKKE